MQIFWARLASFGHLGLISNPLIVSKFHNETNDSKGPENKIYNIVKGRETLYRRNTVPITSCSEIKYVLKKVILWKQRMHQLKLECASFGHLGLINDPLMVLKFHNETHDPKNRDAQQKV